MRTKRSIKNIITAMLSYVITLIFGFIARSFFVKILGQEYLGLNSLFTNIISVMSVVELGFGSAIIYNLYKPLSEKNISVIKSLMQFYKNVYRVIACLVFVIGMVIMPFIPKIVGQNGITENIYIIFFLFVFDTTASYLLTYKRSLFYADQKNYIVNIIHTILYMLINIIQIVTLFWFGNYIIYLIIQIILHILENVIISIYVNKKYTYIQDKSDLQPLNNLIKKDIIQKVKGLFFHQIGSVIVLGTDNIIISITKTLGIVAVGKYSNYVMIINNLNSMTSQLFSSVTASVGNLLVEKSEEEVYQVYKRILFLNAFLCNFICVSVCCIMEPFISIWLGRDYILPSSVLLVVTINFYVQGMKRTCGMLKNAAGIFYEDRYVPLAEALCNLIFSLAFVQIFGLSGVCLGTIVSSALHWFYDFPVFVYKKLFHQDLKTYISDYIQYILVFAVSLILTYFFVISRIMTDKLFLNLWMSIIVCLVFPNIFFILMFMRKKEFLYWYQLCVQKISILKHRYLK